MKFFETTVAGWNKDTYTFQDESTNMQVSCPYYHYIIMVKGLLDYVKNYAYLLFKGKQFITWVIFWVHCWLLSKNIYRCHSHNHLLHFMQSA